MISRQVNASGKPASFGCDARCDKAWGITNRPRVMLGDGEDPDDYAFLADGELGDAPERPGTWEGGHGKPASPEDRLNKWCYRQCERSADADTPEGIVLPDFSRRRYNRHDRQSEADASAR